MYQVVIKIKLKKLHERLITVFGIATLVAMFFYQVGFAKATNESSYQVGFSAAYSGYDCYATDPDCDAPTTNATDECSLPLPSYDQSAHWGLAPGFSHMQLKDVPLLKDVLTNSTACEHGFIDGFVHWCSLYTIHCSRLLRDGYAPVYKGDPVLQGVVKPR
jgi:hypothetical protein